MQISVLRANTGIIQASGDGIDWGNLPVFVLAEIGFHPMENAELSGGDSRRRFKRVYAPPGSFTSYQAHCFISNKMIKAPDGIGASSHTSYYRVREPAFLLKKLLFDLF